MLGVARVVWNLTDPEQKSYLTATDFFAFVAVPLVILPFAGAAAGVIVGRVRGGCWS